MISYIIRRLILIVPVLIGVSILAFLMTVLAPGDPASIMAGPQASESDIENIRVKLKLDRPLHIRYFTFLKGIVTFDLGQSVQSQKPVREMLLTRYPNTLVLATASMIIATIVGLIAGIISGVKQYSVFDYMSMFVALIGISFPTFWIGLVLMYIFSVKLRILPVSGLPAEWWTVEGLRHLILPAITLGVYSAALIARMTRSSILDILQNDYIRTAKAKGVKGKRIVFKHILKNAFIPVITVIGLNFGRLLAGTVITESVFGINGIGRLAVRAINTRDFPVVQGCVLTIAFTFVFINLIVDILYAFLDPRISYS
ncbi:MAG TPA: ABC transporter permease [Halanaerobiales bacterium]|nr:ABC transporter permease [Halanaerobiales bacterium]